MAVDNIARGLAAGVGNAIATGTNVTASAAAPGSALEETGKVAATALGGVFPYPDQEPFNAVGDGVADDTAAMQAIIDAYGRTGFRLRPGAKYKIMRSLAIDERFVMSSDGSYTDNPNAGMSPGGTLITYCENVFVGRTPGTPTAPFRSRVQLRGCSFIDRLGGIGGALFSKIQLYDSLVRDNFFYNYSIGFDAVLSYISRIQFNRFLNIGKSAVSNRSMPTIPALVDSYIENNYINGNGSFSAGYGLDLVGPAATYVGRNFFDFWENCIRWEGGQDFTVADNIFDFSYRGVYLRNTANVRLTDNIAGHTNRSHMSRFPGNHPNKVGAFAMAEIRENVENMVLSRNQGSEETEQLIMFGAPDADFARLGLPSADIIYNLRNIRSDGTNSIRGNYDRRKVIAWQRFSSSDNDGRGCFIEEMMREPVQTLPNPTLWTGAGIVSFDGHVVNMGGQDYQNFDSEWKLPNGDRRTNGTPNAGFWRVGDRWVHAAPAVGSPPGGVCTVAGTFNPTARAANTNVQYGTRRSNAGNLYRCAQKGATDGGSGPTGTGSGIVDGTVVWDYMGPATNPTFVNLPNL